MNNTTLSFRRAARKAVIGTVICGNRGRTDSPRRVTMSTPVVTIPGDSAPVVTGYGFWKTTIHNGDFSRILYTPSTLQIEVGENWQG